MSTFKEKIVTFALSQGPLVKHVKSLLWQGGCIAFITFLGYVTDNVGVLELSPTATTILGLVLARVTKHFNNVIQEQNEVR